MQTQTITGFRLAPQQKRLWNLQQNNHTFCSQASILLQGNLQPEILQTAIRQVVNHHDILKTTLYSLPGVKTPVMVIADKNSFNWEYLDLSKSHPEHIPQQIKEIFGKLRQEQQTYPLCVYLIKLSDIQHNLIISLPALYADTQSIKNLVNQISQAYAQCCQGKEFNADYVQYVQFSEWQNQLLEDEDAEAAQEYWQQQRISSLSALKLPHEQESEPQQFISDSYQLAINQELFKKINYFAEKCETTPDVILLTCWKILIWRLTQESEIVIGTASDRRDYDELQDVLGLLATWLPIKTKFTPNLNFNEVLTALTQTLENATEWQDYFVPEAVEQNSFLAFPIGFEFANIAEIKSDNPEVTFSVQYISSFIEPFKVKLNCLQSNHGLLIDVYYDINYFSQETIQSLAKKIQILLINIIDNPDIPISQLGILSASDRQKLLVEFNQTKAHYQREKFIHQLFAEQVEKTPEQIAVVFENEKFTYRELNLKANQLAHYLQKLGVKPETVVGICVERSPKFIISLLAVLKAGGAYLPLDPTLPQEALQFRLQNAQASVLIRDWGLGSQSRAEVPSVERTGVIGDWENEINLDDDWEEISQESTENPINDVKPENLVYVIYTSGSTGKPKGVAVEHQQLLNYLYGILPKLQLPANASYASVSTFAADLGNTVIFPCLCSGGCLHIVSWERASDPAALADYFRLHPIDCLKIVPSHLTALLSSESWEILPRQLLILGGEAADWNLIETIQKNAPHCRILNHYGPTETTVGVLTYSVGEKIQETATVPIGKPIANTQVYVLDANLQPVPLRVVGELYIGGESLARGYLNSPELTTQRFITNPLCDGEQKLYKTGDRVRYLSDGNLEFLGRLDDQVKIRGYRIELGEITTALNQHPAVRESVVIVREETSTQKRLVAYIVPTSHSVSDHDFRNFLKAKLPEYMIPASFVILKALPLTANGKLDRNALPAPEEVVSRETTFIAPRTPVEEVLASIWAQLLGIQQVSIDDNFFELGGHSLLATQVISRIRTTFGVEMPLPQLFESANLAALAAQIEIAMRGEQQEITTIIPVHRNQNIPLSFAQQRLWFFDQFEPGSPSYNLPRVVRLQGKLNIDALSASLNEIIKRHEILRTSFVISDGQPIQVISDAINLKLPVIDLQNIPQEQREAELYHLTKEEAQTGFDLTQAPLLRAKLLQLDAEDYVILLTLHHIISDGWSTDILIREVAALYTDFCAGKPFALPQLPIQYADFALWQRQWLEEEALNNQLAYWQQQLSGELPILQLPTDRPRPTVQTYAGKNLSFVLPKSLSEGLKTLSKQEGVTLFMTLLAAFKTLLYRYTNQPDILVGSPIANRNRAEIENLIGFFVNTLVLRSNLSGNPTFRDLLKQVREVALGAYAHQDLPFEKLVEEIQPERNLSHNPLFQVMFVLQNALKRPLELPGLSVQPLENDGTTAKFDLTLVIEDVEQGLVANFEYNTDLFDEITISRLATNFEVLLQGIITNPQQHIGELPLLTTTEKQQLLEWGQGEISLQPELCLHQLFAAQVEKTPDAVAVVFENEKLTYQELNQRANQLAHYLQKLGVEKEVLVGICVERSLYMLIGILAILKAGGAYVPLDPAYPKERLGYMLADAQVSVLLTQKHLLETLPAHNAQTLCLDADENLFLTQSTANPISNATSQNLAYVIYTSGSTGQPKGVLINHSHVVRLFAAVEPWYNFHQQDVWTLFHSYAFDFSVWEIWGALLYGGKLVVVPYWVSRSPQAFYELLSQEQVTVLNQTPSAFRQLIQAEESASQIWDLKLRLVIFGGEALDIQSLQPWFARHGDKSPQLVNMYGITETTVHVTYRPLTMADLHTTASVIGQPIPDLQVYLLDPHQQLVPIGVPGEMYIGGAGLARGYLNRPDITQQRFIAHPLSQQGKLYKSGDLARYLPNGDIEYLGRIDHQVKIRGFRIELGEIESALSQHPNVQVNVVIAREDKPGEQRLVAYVVSKSQQDIKTSELRRFLAEKLPSYMLPTAFVILDKLPLTPNGKVDRQALPAPDTTTGLSASFVPPRTPTEQIIADIWADVLGQEKIGIYDNFFDLGGHSLLATQVISRLREVFNIDLPLRSLFENPTVINLVERVEVILAVQQLQAASMQKREDREEIEL